MTKQRRLILDTVNRSMDHPTAEEIFLRAKAQMPSIVLATVYNNLNALTAQGQIRRVHSYGSPDRYDNVKIAHDHLVCDCCGSMSDIVVRDFVQEIQSETGIYVTSYELNIHYICENCQQKRTKGDLPQ